MPTQSSDEDRMLSAEQFGAIVAGEAAVAESGEFSVLEQQASVEDDAAWTRERCARALARQLWEEAGREAVLSRGRSLPSRS